MPTPEPPAAAQPEAACPMLPPELEPLTEAPVPATTSAAPVSLRDATYAVGGMTCASCSAIIEKVLGKTAGVDSAVVNLATEKLSVTYDPDVIDADGIAAAVDRIGYSATLLGTPGTAAEAPGKVTLGLIGMTCASCASVIEKALLNLPGVQRATVNLAANSGTVEFDPELVGIDELITAVRGEGYDAVVKIESIPGETGAVDVQAEAQAKAYAHEVFMFWFAVAFSLPLLLIAMVPPFMTAVPMALSEVLANTLGGMWDPMMASKYLMFLLAAPVQFVAGARFYKGAYHAIKRRSGNMDLLVAIGTSAAFFYSAAATFIPALQSEPAFYETSVADALAAHKPFALIFATPAFCKSQLCGPTLDSIKPIAEAHPDVTFINVEPYVLEYTDGQLQPVLDANQQLQAAPATDEWGLLSEPWIFVVDGDGIVRGSFEGVVGEAELERALAEVEG
jgi:copper ion binding protein